MIYWIPLLTIYALFKAIVYRNQLICFKSNLNKLYIKLVDNEVLQRLFNNNIEIILRENVSILLNEIGDKIDYLNKYTKELEECIREKDKLLEGIKGSSSTIFSDLSLAMSDLILVQYNISEKYLISKSRPAFVEADRISKLRKKTKLYIAKYKEMLYKYELFLNLFPELAHYVDDLDQLIELENIISYDDLKEDFDRVQLYIPKDDYLKLDVDLRNQLALDKYINGNKTKWQIGRDYELFCGIDYERKGWKVEYYGMEKKLNDLGRDLIAKKGNEVHIIQCKYWAKNKVIHEKHILQLFGTATIEQRITSDLFKVVKPIFITNITLSDKAKEFAELLNVSVVTKEFNEFPRIKCNIGTNDNGSDSMIYHLPFDQHYDRTKIVDGKGFYAWTVKEATDKGFRRSFRYNNQE